MTPYQLETSLIRTIKGNTTDPRLPHIQKRGRRTLELEIPNVWLSHYLFKRKPSRTTPTEESEFLDLGLNVAQEFYQEIEHKTIFAIFKEMKIPQMITPISPPTKRKDAKVDAKMDAKEKLRRKKKTSRTHKLKYQLKKNVRRRFCD